MFGHVHCSGFGFIPGHDACWGAYPTFLNLDSILHPRFFPSAGPVVGHGGHSGPPLVGRNFDGAASLSIRLAPFSTDV